MSKQKGLSEVDRRILERKLNQDSKVLKNQFTSLLVKIQSYLLRVNCDCEILRMCVLCMEHVKVAVKDSILDEELESAKSTARIITILVKRDLLSFLHYDFIEEIVTSCCEESSILKALLEKYKEAYDEYIKRRVCETSLYREGEFKEFTGSDSEGTVELLLITDEKWDGYTPFARVKDFEYIIQMAFRCNKFLLTLKSIEPRCLKLRYALIPSLVDHIFPLTLEEWNKLKSHGVAEIHCRDYHYMVDGKCKMRMIHILCNVALTVLYFHIAAATGKGFGDVVCTDQQYSSKGMLLSKERISYSHVQCENHFKMPFRLLCRLRNVPGQR